jgi:hypothetical protein
LYAVSTAELDRPVNESETPNIDLDVIADDIMWDAILASVPEQPALPVATTAVALKNEDIKKYAGEYVFSPLVTVKITTDGNKVFAQTLGKRPAFAIKTEASIELTPTSRTDFLVQDRYPLTLSFAKHDQMVINAGRWQQIGTRKRK